MFVVFVSGWFELEGEKEKEEAVHCGFCSSDPSSLPVRFAKYTTVAFSAAVSRHVGLRASPSSLGAAQHLRLRIPQVSCLCTFLYNTKYHKFREMGSMPISQVTSRFCAKLGLTASEVYVATS